MTRTRPLVLIVDDDRSIAQSLAAELSASGYDVVTAADGREGLQLFRDRSPDLVLTDLAMPVADGFEMVAGVRAIDETPVVVLSVRGGDRDKIRALDLGADDYVTKPFSTVVLLARMSALLRRRPDVAPVLTVGRLRLEPRRHRCWVDDDEVMLTAREYAVLTYLAERVDQAVSKQELLDEVWEESGLDPNVVEVCVMQLRKKVGSDVIQTVRNVGYRLVEQPA